MIIITKTKLHVAAEIVPDSGVVNLRIEQGGLFSTFSYLKIRKTPFIEYMVKVSNANLLWKCLCCRENSNEKK
jgi:hypothetical protein